MKMLKPKFWAKEYSLLALILFPLSIILQVLIYFKKRITKKKQISIPVICVGNIYLGGTGKTPLSIEIAKILEKFNKKTAIIKKSYKDHEDEYKLIAFHQVPLFRDTSRYMAINEAIKHEFDCVVLDDGFQDFSINKDLNILCFNERQLIGNGMTLPSGPLRQPLSSLKECQIIVINGNISLKLEKMIKNISNNISIYYSKYVPTNLKSFKNKNLLAFAGIGNTDNFFYLLENSNLTIEKKVSFPDHYNYSLKELNKLIDFALSNNLKIITTEKDYFRIKHFQLPHIEYLDLKLEISNRSDFEKKIIKYL